MKGPSQPITPRIRVTCGRCQRPLGAVWVGTCGMCPQCGPADMMPAVDLKRWDHVRLRPTPRGNLSRTDHGFRFGIAVSCPCGADYRVTIGALWPVLTANRPRPAIALGVDVG